MFDEMIDNQHLILYDGDCMLCNNFLKYVVLHDNGYFKLADQNSKKFNYLIKYRVKGKESIYYYSEGKIYSQSKAISKILSHCNNLASKIAYWIIQLTPRFIGDFFYDTVAEYRRMIYGINNSCLVPTGEI